MAKLEKILESMDSFKINSEVALLENTDLTDLTRAQTRKEIHEREFSKPVLGGSVDLLSPPGFSF